VGIAVLLIAVASKTRGRGTPRILVGVANDDTVTSRRAERILAYMLASALGLSIIAMLASIIGGQSMDGVWPVIRVLPLIGLPIGVLLLLALLVVSSIRRGREAKDARN